MRDSILAVLVAVAVSAGINYWTTERSISGLRDELRVQSGQLAVATSALDQLRTAPSIVSVNVYSIGGGRCESTSDPRKQVYQAGKVHWMVHRFSAEARKCFQNGETVKIVPKPGNVSPLTPQMPFDANVVKADLTGALGTYAYQVWLADKAGNNLYMMEDPELEIIEIKVK